MFFLMNFKASFKLLIVHGCSSNAAFLIYKLRTKLLLDYNMLLQLRELQAIVCFECGGVVEM